MPAAVPADQPGRLPLTILTYTLPSRYCESDRFGPSAWELFGKVDGPGRAGAARSAGWVGANVAYAPGSTDGRTSAWDVWQARKGVCRDYTHLAIALCRALSIPARYVGGYAVGLVPMDFHACFEAYLGGELEAVRPDRRDSPGADRRGDARARRRVRRADDDLRARRRRPVRVECSLAAPEPQSAGIRIE